MYTLNLLGAVHWQWGPVGLEKEGEEPVLKEGRGSIGGSFTKGTEARIPKAEDERRRSRAQPSATE
jgi:hypothetical protein